jgi:mannose-6-phosphate isomerase
MFPLACQVQSYDWGKRGTDSAVAKLKGVGVDDSKPYAELWMGTHPSGPARVAATNELLADWLRANPSAVGHVPAGYAGSDLPFLFKVLSIQTALSIQAHPDKALARDLHARYPDVYKDPNHKPEMAIALTPFEAMCGFRPVAEIKNHLAAYPELAEIVGADARGSFVAAEGDGRDGSHSGPLRGLFRAFMDCPEDKAKQQVAALVARLSSTSPAGTSSSGNGGGAADDDAFVRSLIVRLNRDYPGDRGALCPLLLNCLRLAEGEVRTTTHKARIDGQRTHLKPRPTSLAPCVLTRRSSWAPTSRTRTYRATASRPWRCPTTSSAPDSRPSSETWRRCAPC